MAAHQNEYKRALETDAAGHDADADADEQQYFCETCSLVLPSVCHAQQHCRIEHPESIE